jgi:hypothetical protein
MSRRRRFTIGDPVTVLVHRVDAERREIDFRLTEMPPAGARPPLSRRPLPRRKRS